MKYADWLENPVDPPPVCLLSQKELTEEDEKIRFMNMRTSTHPGFRFSPLPELFSLEAIDEYGKNLPPNTALAGFVIPGTNVGIRLRDSQQL